MPELPDAIGRPEQAAAFNRPQAAIASVAGHRECRRCWLSIDEQVLFGDLWCPERFSR
jgi:hypothetical protein